MYYNISFSLYMSVSQLCLQLLVRFSVNHRPVSYTHLFLEFIILVLKQQLDTDILLILFDYFYMYQFIDEVDKYSITVSYTHL